MSYGIKYKVPFKTASEIACEIQIAEKNYVGNSVELIAGSTPISISYQQGDLLSPIRASSATVQVYGSDYLQDLYSSDPQGVKVTLLRDGLVSWIGFLTPDTFSQDFSSPEFIYELECVSAFSTLKYKEFDLTDDFVTFWDIVDEARSQAGYNDVYYTNSVKAETSDYFALKIASANFYDELGEAMSYYEAMEEIAKFAGCCWVPYEDDLYFLDYQAIRSGYNSYTKNDGINSTQITLQDLKNVTDYKGTGTKLSRIAGKNKAIVNCSLYEVDNIIPEVKDSLSNIGALKSTVSSKLPDKKAVRHYLVTIPAHVRGDRIHTLNQGIDRGGSSFTYVVRYTEDAIPNKLNFEEELRVIHYINKEGPKLTTNDAIMSIRSERGLLIHNKTYLSFSCDIMFGVEGTTVSGEGGLIMLEPSTTAETDTTWTMPLKLRIGEYYYNGTTWTKTETKFNTFFLIKKDEKKYGRFITTRDDNDYTLGIGDLSGTIIQPPSQSITGELELTIYTPNVTIPNTRYGLKYSFYKNIKMGYAVQDLDGVYRAEKEKEDVVYESVTSEDFIEEADEIDLKICTNTDGKLALSSVLEGNNFLKELRTDVFGKGVAEEILLQRVVSLFARPRFMINPTLENNAKPYTKFTEPHLNRQFLVAGGEEDVKMEAARYNLIEA